MKNAARTTFSVVQVVPYLVGGPQDAVGPLQLRLDVPQVVDQGGHLLRRGLLQQRHLGQPALVRRAPVVVQRDLAGQPVGDGAQPDRQGHHVGQHQGVQLGRHVPRFSVARHAVVGAVHRRGMVCDRLGVQAVQLGGRVEDYSGRLAVGGGVLVQWEVGQKGQVSGEVVGHFGNLVTHLAVWRRPE